MKGTFDAYWLCTGTFGPKSSKSNSRPVFCLQLWGILGESTIWNPASRQQHFKMFWLDVLLKREIPLLAISHLKYSGMVYQIIIWVCIWATILVASRTKSKLTTLICECLNISTTPITAIGCQQCLPLIVVQLKAKYYQK
jgi:hypothetical protein